MAEIPSSEQQEVKTMTSATPAEAQDLGCVALQTIRAEVAVQTFYPGRITSVTPGGETATIYAFDSPEDENPRIRYELETTYHKGALSSLTLEELQDKQ